MPEQQIKVQEILEQADKANREILKQLIDAGATPHCISEYALAIKTIQDSNNVGHLVGERPLVGGGLFGSGSRVGLYYKTNREGSDFQEHIKALGDQEEESRVRFGRIERSPDDQQF